MAQCLKSTGSIRLRMLVSHEGTTMGLSDCKCSLTLELLGSDEDTVMERKELIKVARDSQHALAFAHLTYFRSLQNVQNELKSFIEETLTICSNTGPDDQTVEEILQPQDSSSGSDDDDGCDNVGDDGCDCGSDGGGNDDYDDDNNANDDNSYNDNNDNDGDDDEYVADIKDNDDSSSCDNVKDQEEDDDDDDEGIISFMDFGDGSSDLSGPQPEDVCGGIPPLGISIIPPYSNGISFEDSTYSMPNTSSAANNLWNLPPNSFNPSQNQTTMPSSSAGSSLQNFGFHFDANGGILGGRTDYTGGSSKLPQYESATQQNVMDFPCNNSWHYQTYDHFDHPSNALPHEVSTLGYLSPFNLVEGTFPNSYSQGNCATSFGSNGMYFRELREREGIPDLEDEVDDPIMEFTSGEEYLNSNDDAIEFLSEAAALEDGNDVISNQMEEVRPTSPALESLMTEDIKKCGISGRAETHTQKDMENNYEIQYLYSQTDESIAESRSEMFPDSSGNLHEVRDDIKEMFDDIVMHGKHVLQMLGPYQQGTAVINGFTSSIESLTALSRETSPTVNGTSENHNYDTCATLCNLSLTLEKLCILESKLYEEVKDEEKLRKIFDEECKKVKELDDRGAEPSKVEAAQLSLRTLTFKVSVAVSIVEGTARRTHKLRDEELHPQLSELIQRLLTMWKCLFEAHNKQFQATVKALANFKMTCTITVASLKAIQKLEAGILKLGTAFSDWMKSHRAFPTHLLNWLAKFLHQDSVSPSDLPTPIVFALCNNWFYAVEKVSEANVLQALDNFKLLLFQLRRNVQEVKQQRLKIESLTHYHEKKLRKYCTKIGVEWEQWASFLTGEVESNSAIETGNRSLDVMYATLRPIRIKINEANIKHERMIKQANVVAAEVFERGVLQVLESLGSFSLEMFEAYEQLQSLI